MGQLTDSSSPFDDKVPHPAAAAPIPTSHPAGFYFVFWGEFAERCSYYGMRAILPLYLTAALLLEDSTAKPAYFTFKMACYFLPLVGGFVADRYFGKYWTIVGFSVPYVLGHFILGMQTPLTLVVALVLLACGSGVIKPNISTLMGKTYDQKRPGQKALLTSAFLWFYFSINVGATISQVGLPQLRERLIEHYLAPYELVEEPRKAADGTDAAVWHAKKDGATVEISKQEAEKLKLEARRYAYPIAFQIPAWLMVLSLGVFALGKKFYAVEVIEPHPTVTPEERAQRWVVLSRLFGVFALLVFFWTAYEQNDSLWTYFARDHMVQTVTDPVTGSESQSCLLNIGFRSLAFPPDGFQFVNSALIIILVPLAGLMWTKIDPQGVRFPPTRKIFMGFLVTAASVGTMACAGFLAAGGNVVSPWWLVLAYFLLTVGEILVYGTGLELSYIAAPENMKGFVTACFLVTIALGDLVNIPLAPVCKRDIAEGPFFALMAAMVLAASIAFIFVGRRFNRPAAAKAGAPA